MNTDTATASNNGSNYDGAVVVGVDLVDSHLEEGSAAQQNNGAAAATSGNSDNFKDEASLNTNKTNETGKSGTTNQTSISDSYHSDPTNNGAFLSKAFTDKNSRKKALCYGIALVILFVLIGIAIVAVIVFTRKEQEQPAPIKDIETQDEGLQPTAQPTNSPTHKPTISKFAWDIELLPESPITMITSEPNDREITMKYKTALRDYKISAYQADCATPIVDDIITFKSGQEQLNDAEAIVSAYFDVDTENVVNSPVWQESTDPTMYGTVRFCTKIELGMGSGENFESVNFKETILNINIPKEFEASFGVYVPIAGSNP